MSVVGDFAIPADSFASSQALAAVPEMTVVARPLAFHATKEVLPFLCTTGDDFDWFQQVLETDATVAEWSTDPGSRTHRPIRYP